MSITSAMPREVDGREPFVVLAARPRFELRARDGEFELEPGRGKQLLAIRLLLRLLVTWPDAPQTDGLEELGVGTAPRDRGPHLRYGRMRMAARQDVLHAVVADPEAAAEQLTAAIEVRRALRRILKTNLGGLDCAFPVQGHDALDLDIIDPDVDLVTLAREAHELLARDSARNREHLFPVLVSLERKAHAVFRSTQLDVHPHLAPFVDPLRRLHRDILRHIIQVGLFVNEPDDVERAGSRLGRHGSDAFDADTAVAFLQDAMARGPGVLDDRYRALTDAVGDEDRLPESAINWMRRVRIERGGSGNKVRPGDLRTGDLCRARDAPWLALGVHRADGALCDSDGLTPYVRRPEHAAVGTACQQALDAEQFALIAVGGPSAAGKTRLLYETLRDVASNHWVIAPVPHRARDVHRPADYSRLVGSRTVVLWLDDLELFVADVAAPLTAADLIGLRSGGAPQTLVLCTYGGRFRDLCARNLVHAAELERVLALATLRVPLDARLGDVEERDACARFPTHAPDIRNVGLGPALISASRLALRYEDAFPLHVDERLDAKDGLAFVDALLAWRDLLAQEVMTSVWAELAWRALRPLRGRRTAPSEQAWHTAQEWAAAEVAPGASLAWWDDAEEGWRVSPAIQLPDRRLVEVRRQLEPLRQRWRASEPARHVRGDGGGDR